MNLDNLLKGVTNPARYTSNEYNLKIKTNADINFCLCFPDIYEVGMSHLGSSILYNILNLREDTFCERAFSPWTDFEERLKQEDIALFSLETQTPLKDFDILGFSVGYELLFSNVINMLNLAKIPALACDRSDDYPLIIAGGGGVYNIEPICEVFDLIVIGEGEEIINELTDLYSAHRKNKHEFLENAAKISGVYIPAFYDISYNENGTIKAIEKNNANAAFPVEKRIIKNLDEVKYPTKPLVPYMHTVHDRMVLEIFRGCTHGCRFCQAGYIYRPVREKNVDTLISQAKEIYANTGCDEISLCSLSSGDYSNITELLTELNGYFSEKRVSVGLPSLRVDTLNEQLSTLIRSVRKTGLTVAIEAGSQRLRDIINKNLSEEEILNNVHSAFLAGYSTVKLYFMIGLPGETYEDLDAIYDITYKIREKYYCLPKESRIRAPKITVSASCFVPKPFTPFFWIGQNSLDLLKEKQYYLKDKFKSLRGVKFNYHDANLSFFEAVMARGNRKLLPVIIDAVNNGAKFDAWNEFFDLTLWRSSFERFGLNPEFFANRDISENEVLPFDTISCGVSKEYLQKELKKGETTTPDCRLSCQNCGMKGGLCI